MFYGKITEELRPLYRKYREMFGVFPDFYEELEYGDADYADFVSDIEEAIREKKELPFVVFGEYEDDVDY